MIASGWKQSFVEVSVSDFCSADQSPLSGLVEAADDHFFSNIVCIKEQVLNLGLGVCDYSVCSNFNFGYRYLVNDCQTEARMN